MNKMKSDTLYTLPKLKKLVAKEYPEYKLVQKEKAKAKYSGMPADKTRVSR